jgi:hypothetical protein
MHGFPSIQPLRARRFAYAVAVALAFASIAASRLAADSPVITEASIRGHMDFLASDALNGRGSGTHDEWLAATYIGSQLGRWGLEPLGDNGGFVQKVDTGRSAAWTAPQLVVGGREFNTGVDFLGRFQGTGSVSGRLAHYTAGTPVGDNAFVIVPDSVTADPADTAKAAAILSLPAAPGARGQRAAGGGAGGGRGAAPAMQPWRLTLARPTYDALVAMTDGSPASIAVDVEPGHTWNVLARLTGSDAKMKDEVIVLTAHLDHLGVCSLPPDTICNGADDDASGSIAVLEMAEALAKGKRPKRTILFAWFGSEETGGAGARHFLEQPPIPLSQMVANLEFEMIGRADPMVPPHSLWLTGYERSNLGPTLAKQGARIVQDPRPDQQFFQRSDNIQLARKGIVAQTVSSFNLHTDYHRATDDIAHIDFAHMTEAIQSMFDPIVWLANSDFKPAWLPGQCPAPCGGGHP